MSTDVRGDTPGVVETAVRTTRIAAFCRRIFASLPRADQRRWAEIYLRGLLLGSGPKSIRRTVEEVLAEPGTQSLQQFINQSPWDWRPVRRRIAAEAEQSLRPHAWVLETAVTPKRGDWSVGVDRRYVPTRGKVLNCQLAMGLFAASDRAAVPVDWRLLLTDRWITDPGRRDKARIPEDARARTACQEVLSIIDRARTDRSMAPRPLLAEWKRSPDVAELVDGLARRSQDFVIQIGEPAATAGAGRWTGWPSCWQPYREERGAWRVSPQRILIFEAPGQPRTEVVANEVTVPAPRGPAEPALRMIRARQLNTRQRYRYWITNLRYPTGDIMRLLQASAVSHRASMSLHDDYGFSDFEGRSFIGWHHHVTLVSAACAYALLYA